MKSYNVLFTQAFKDMFKYQIDKYTVYSPSFASKIEKSLYNMVQFIKIFPYATSTIKLRGKTEVYRKFVILKKFLVVFKLVNKTIYLSYFLDGRMSPNNYFKNYNK